MEFYLKKRDPLRLPTIIIAHTMIFHIPLVLAMASSLYSDDNGRGLRVKVLLSNPYEFSIIPQGLETKLWMQ